MPPPNGMIEINRPRADVFNYATDPRVRPDWQDAVQEIEVETTLPYGRGSRVRERRQAQGRLPTYRWEVIEYEPPRRWSFHGIDGPVRAIATMTFTELGDAERTLVNFEIEKWLWPLNCHPCPSRCEERDSTRSRESETPGGSRDLAPQSVDTHAGCGTMGRS